MRFLGVFKTDSGTAGQAIATPIRLTTSAALGPRGALNKHTELIFRYGKVVIWKPAADLPIVSVAVRG